MKNFIQKGKALTLTAPYDLTSGDGVMVGTIFGVSHGDALTGELTVVNTIGVYHLKALTAAVATEGANAYWDAGNREVTPQASGNTLIGAFAAAKASAETSAKIWLRP